ncbi:PREDICTED: uncharacterized protein LOC108375296 [Rhagoletis zephyria]|uniref:uncharacterized protein LOC108375296 n=1 Tax=Rhagoletis zephyria TaxID=28612 RepID=UPI0008115C8C|nr:PREDICTED: uncharacterized protein LOC108375296 [Rhagoletis zephyria]
MALRLKETIVLNHNKIINRFYFWTDSYTVIRWVRADHRRYKQYVANRVAEILEASDMRDWRWCPGPLNPADDATRAKFPANYNPDGRWKNGPEFLLEDENLWQKESLIANSEEHSGDELRVKYTMSIARQVYVIMPDIDRFSNYSRLKRSVAWIHRYVQNLLRKVRHEAPTKGELTVDEERQAETHLIKFVQERAYAEELADIKRNGAVSTCSTLETLNPFVANDGMLRGDALACRILSRKIFTHQRCHGDE